MYRIVIFLFFFIAGQHLCSMEIDSTSFKINPRLSFYSHESTCEMILHVPGNLIMSNLEVSISLRNEEVAKWKGIPGKKLLQIDFPLGFEPGIYQLKAGIKSSTGAVYSANTSISILKSKPNEVKTDCLTGALLLNKRVFFPFGFYCYSPVDPVLPEEEVIKGFNMISPYQKILPETFPERKAYMDRCAEIGMKVHYNLLSVSGGGGVSSKIEGITELEKRERLISEIKAFMDHPALLAWYISDEPNGYKIPPSELEEIYQTIKALDPWHPVSIVFMAPFMSSVKYAKAMDIVMADPYPVPGGSVGQVGNVARQLADEFRGKKAVWLVPQAFGGGEWWDREPTILEVRNMTYQAIVQGARGIQYFVRHGPNSFPKSTATWNECGKIAMEIAEISPWLLSDEKPFAVKSSSPNILTWSGSYAGKLVIIVVNKLNTPQRAEITISGKTEARARVLFENRFVTINAGIINDYLPAFGTQVFLVDLHKPEPGIKPFRGNLVKDPGFEDLSSPGVPASCYAWNEGDRGSTYFLDTREPYEGLHSLRMVTPAENKGTRLRFFPINIEKGRTYIISVVAKTDIPPVSGIDKPWFELGLGDYGRKRFIPDSQWKEFSTFVTIPSDSIPSPRTNVILRMPGKGIAWFDMVQVISATDINRSINPAIKDFWKNQIDQLPW